MGTYSIHSSSSLDKEFQRCITAERMDNILEMSSSPCHNSSWLLLEIYSTFSIHAVAFHPCCIYLPHTEILIQLKFCRLFACCPQIPEICSAESWDQPVFYSAEPSFCGGDEHTKSLWRGWLSWIWETHVCSDSGARGAFFFSQQGCVSWCFFWLSVLILVSWVSVQTKMVDSALLSSAEINWLNDYHAQVWEKVRPYFENRWLKREFIPP